MKLLIIVLLGYFTGSVPFALVIGKLFYKTDVREYGSGNLGGGNTGRVLGKRAGLSVMTLDLLKVSLVVLLAVLIDGSDLAVSCGALAAGIGHCFPVFAHFKGGKAVAALYGFIFGLIVCCGRSVLYFLVPLCIFMAVLCVSRITALASIVSSVCFCIGIWILPESLPVKCAVTVYLFMILVRHRSNLVRMRSHTENKISWM